MKKFIIVIVFVFLIAILISFNYLLWDREKQLENYQDLSNAKNLSIDTLGEKINNLDKLNKELNQQIETLTRENGNMKEDVAVLNKENIANRQALMAKNALTSLLKDNLNVAPLESVIKNWVEAVSAKNYKAAQELISKTSTEEILSDPENFKSTYQGEIKAIRLKSLMLFTEFNDDEHLGKIQFEAVLEADKPEPTDKSGEIPQRLYKEGENKKYFTMEYDPHLKEWRISEITDVP